jgi:hypothetical protein
LRAKLYATSVIVQGVIVEAPKNKLLGVITVINSHPHPLPNPGGFVGKFNFDVISWSYAGWQSPWWPRGNQQPGMFSQSCFSDLFCSRHQKRFAFIAAAPGAVPASNSDLKSYGQTGCQSPMFMLMERRASVTSFNQDSYA